MRKKTAFISEYLNLNIEAPAYQLYDLVLVTYNLSSIKFKSKYFPAMIFKRTELN